VEGNVSTFQIITKSFWRVSLLRVFNQEGALALTSVLPLSISALLDALRIKYLSATPGTGTGLAIFVWGRP